MGYLFAATIGLMFAEAVLLRLQAPWYYGRGPVGWSRRVHCACRNADELASAVREAGSTAFSHARVAVQDPRTVTWHSAPRGSVVNVSTLRVHALLDPDQRSVRVRARVSYWALAIPAVFAAGGFLEPARAARAGFVVPAVIVGVFILGAWWIQTFRLAWLCSVLDQRWRPE